jgi:integrase
MVVNGFTDLAQAVIAAYSGRDSSFPSRLQFWIDHFGCQDISAITSDDIEDGIDSLISRGKLQVLVKRTGENKRKCSASLISTGKPLSPSTVNRYVACLGTMFKDLRRMRLLPRGFVSPMRDVARQQEGAGRTVNVTVADVLRLVAACRVSRNRKLAAQVALACTTGWRLGTIQGLCWGDLDLHLGTADTARTKNGTPHRAVLLPWVITELKNIKPHTAQYGDKVFGSVDIRRAWTTALVRADLPQEWTFHHCRHIAASVLAQSGASVPVIMSCLNHKSPLMALRYTHLNVATLRENLDKAWS